MALIIFRKYQLNHKPATAGLFSVAGVMTGTLKLFYLFFHILITLAPDEMNHSKQLGLITGQ